jgi:octaprenyl-diphosphate synthase
MTAGYMEAARELAGADLATELASDIAACEAQLRSRLGSRSEAVERIGNHVTDAGGKRLRPLFLSLAARATGRSYMPERVAALGACIEMIHMATLIHDDVIDNATTRRGRATAGAIWGNTASILTGDVLLAKAMDILAEDGDLRIIRTVSAAVVEMAEGEVMEVEARGDFDLSHARHLEILRRKTAALIACSCRVGALVAGADPETEAALASFGEALGLAFQISDDVLDLRGDPAKTGKPRATDFREGCATLPLIHLRPMLSGQEDEFVRSRFGNGVSDEEIDAIVALLEDRSAISASLQEAAVFGDKARSVLEGLPEIPSRRLLSGLADLMVCREA